MIIPLLSSNHMRHIILLILAAFLGLAAIQPVTAVWAAPASSQGKGNTAQDLKNLETQFEALRADAKKAGLRDNWLKLEERFKNLSAKSSGDTAARAAFFTARCREELGQRSYTASDHRKAVELFAAFDKKYPKSSLVPSSLYRQASILGLRLKDTPKAKAKLATLAKSFPNSQEAKDAPALEAKFSSGGSDASGAAASAGSSAKPAQKTTTAAVMEQLGLTVKTIMIDAGHGGKDPGCRANGIVEKDFTLAMAKRIGKLLEKKGFTVLYTRSKDEFINLEARPDMANSKNADLFISIHVNANTTTSIHGLETYYLDQAKTKNASVVAARENGVSVKELSDVQFILTDLMLTSKVKESRSLAGCVQTAILASLRKGKLTADDHGVRSAPFYVLVGARMPAILVEFGYATNSKEAKNLKSDVYLQRQAQGVVDGILAYREQLAKITK